MVSMKNKLLSFLILFFSISIISCEKNNPVREELPKQLTSTNLDSRCYWSPNGEYIAFLSRRNTYNPLAHEVIWELWIMDKDGSNQRPLLSTNELYEETSVYTVSWSMSSDALLAHIYTPSRSEIWKVSIDGNKTRLSSVDQWAEQPKYSPDGLKVAFIVQGPNPSQGPTVYRLYTANPDFSDTILIVKGLIRGYDWIHDSEGLVFSLYDQSNENFDLWKSSTDGTEKLRLSETSEDENDLVCSYDGNYISYSYNQAVYITPSDIFNSSLLLDNAANPSWIRDRNLILLDKYQTQGNNNWSEAWIVDINGDVIWKLQEGYASEAAVSYSGDYFTYTIEGNIWLDKLP